MEPKRKTQNRKKLTFRFVFIASANEIHRQSTESQGTKELGNQGTKEPGNQGTNKPGNQGTKELGNQGTRTGKPGHH